MVDPTSIIQERERIVGRMCEYFRSRPGVLGMFLRGSLAEGTADAWSDIDFAVVVGPEAFDRFCTERHTAPQAWGKLLLNSGSMGRHMCVSHFEPFIKVDAFYYRPADLVPSARYAHGIGILHDEMGVVRSLVKRSRGLTFEAEPAAVNHGINQAIAGAHEVVRRVERGELAYAQAILADVRHHVAVLDDCLHNRPPMGLSHFETRCRDPQVLAAVTESHPKGHKAEAILAGVQSLVAVLQVQIEILAGRLPLGRCSERDQASVAIVQQWRLQREPC